jgi:hypothetical protein
MKSGESSSAWLIEWWRRGGTGAVVSAALLVHGCGSGAPDIPASLRDCESPAASVDSASAYAAAPYGTREGDVLEDATFEGLRNPSRSRAAADLAAIRFSQYYDPDEVNERELLLISTAAAWCAACREEHRELPAFYEAQRSRGLGVIGILTQDASGNPAVFSDLVDWTERAGTNFPMGLDSELRMGAYASPELAPINLVVDVRTMRILRLFVGDQRTPLKTFVTQELDRRRRGGG